VAFVTTTLDTLSQFVAPFRCYDSRTTTAPYAKGDVLIVDTKAPDWANDDSALWLSRAAGLRIVRIDHPRATHDSCDLLVGPCAHWDVETVQPLRHGFSARLLYGWEYILLAPQAIALVPMPYRDRYDGPIVLCAGGSDPAGRLVQWWQWLEHQETRRKRLFLLPHYAPYILPSKQPHAWQQAIPYAQSHLRHASLVVGLFGVTTYECLWYQTPMLCFARTPDEMRAIECLRDQGAPLWSGGLTQETTQESLCRMLGEYYACGVQETQQRRGPWVDGHGSARVADAILHLGVAP